MKFSKAYARHFLAVLLMAMGLTLPVASFAAAPPSFAETKARAEKGDLLAQTVLGDMYYEGEGVTRDYADAVKWWRKAADQGNAAAQSALGLMYERGNGVTRDFGAAVKWYRKAAEQGNPLAQLSLGLMYERGNGVTRDYEAAYIWIARFAAQGDENAKGYLDMVEKKLTPEQLGRAQKSASNWQPVSGTLP